MKSQESVRPQEREWQEGESDQGMYQMCQQLWRSHAEQELRVFFGFSNMEATGNLDRFMDSE